MAAQVTLTHLVMVRIHVGQPFDALRDAPLAHGLPAGQTEGRERIVRRNAANGPEPVEGLIVINRPLKLPLPLSVARVDNVGLPSGCVVYVLRLHSGQLYIGSTTDLARRLSDHTAGRASRTTALDAPVALIRIEPFDTFASARTREAQLKRWSRAKKEALIRGDCDGLRVLARSRDRRREGALERTGLA